MDLITLALAKKFTTDSLAGLGALKGEDGDSAYEIAVENGFAGTETAWLESLKGEEGEMGPQGDKGKSAYQIALDEGFIGTEEEWLETLKGEIGASGEDGYSPSIAESNENTEDIYKLNIINKDNTITTPNLKGEDGSSGVYLGEEEPSDINIKVWIKPDGNANDGSGGSSEGGISVETLTHILKNYVTTEDYTASLKLKEDIENKVTSFELNFIDADNKKYPTIIALIDYLNKYYYNNSNIDEMIKSMQIDEEGYLTVTLPLLCDGETSGETLVIGKVSGKDGIDGKDGADGIGISNVVINSDGELVLTYTNGESTNLGKVVGADGTNGTDGKDGTNGTNGVGIKTVTLSTDGELSILLTDNTVCNLGNIKGEKGDKGDKGEQGIQGPKGVKGDTGANGSDYILTDDDKAEIATEIKVDLSQLTPEFANSIDECTDTSKVYVLPDGYIYAYIKTAKSTVTYTNLADSTLATDESLTITSDGWMENVRINSSGSVVTASGYDITNMILVGEEEVVRCQGLALNTGYGRIYLFKDNALVHSITVSSATSYFTEISDDYAEISVATLVKILGNNTSYASFDAIRFGGAVNSTKEDVIITLDEEINDPVIVTDYTWANTAHAFIPADYEDRIIALEETVKDIDEIPQYVKAEAERVTDLVLEAMTENSLISAHFSDCHYYYDGIKSESTQAVEHTAYGINEIGKYINLDYIANHGDYDTDVSTDRTKTAVKKINSVLKSDKEIQLVGNHDVVEKPFTESQMFAYIGSQNTHCVLDYENKAGIYGYKDFEHCKIRTIFLNTSDILTSTASSYAMVSPKQLQWIVDKALDFSDKENAEEWAINIISHIPLHWNDNLQQVLQVFDNYIDGASGSVTADGETISYDFSSRTRAEIICYYHGHTHNYMVKYIGTHNTPSLATPQVCSGRYNEYAESAPTLGGEFDDSGNPVYYYKTADTAESTSFVVNVIDRVNRKIHSIHFGAGIDREISY